MIAARFRLVGWTAGVAGAALCCYLASQSVAAERAALAQVDRQIAEAHADIGRLETEIAARSRMGQIERWNTNVLALQAPAPRQYVSSEVQLASLAGGKPLPLDPAIVASHGAVATVAYTRPATSAPAPQAVAPVAPVPEPLLRVATYVRPKVSRLGPQAEAPVVKVAYARPVAAKPAEGALLPDDIGNLIAAEGLGKDRPAKAKATAKAQPKPAADR